MKQKPIDQMLTLIEETAEVFGYFKKLSEKNRDYCNKTSDVSAQLDGMMKMAEILLQKETIWEALQRGYTNGVQKAK